MPSTAASRGEVPNMPLTVTGRVQGQHSTQVDVARCVAIAQKALQTIEVDGRVELQIRCVHVARRTRVAGVYAIGYEVHVPNSAELLLFDDAASGHPATLIAYEQHRLGAVLQCLSSRLHESWQESRRIFGMGRTFVPAEADNSKKAWEYIRQGKNRGRTDDFMKSMISSMRSLLKHQGGYKAKQLIEQSYLGPLTDNAVCRVFWEKCEGGSSAITTLQVLEQFGIIELPAGYRFEESTPAAITLAQSCYDYAQAWIDEQNAEFAVAWLKEKQRLQQDVLNAEHKLRELNAQVVKQKAEAERLQRALEAFQVTKPDRFMSVL